MKIDVIIPTYKPGKELFTLLDLLERQTLIPSTILIINTEKQYFDNLTAKRKLSESYPNLSVVHIKREEFDHGKTRRMAVEMTSSPVFVMMTQDAIPSDNRLLERLTRELFVGEKLAEFDQTVMDMENGMDLPDLSAWPQMDDSEPVVAVAYARQLAGKNSGILEQFSRRFNYPATSCYKKKSDFETMGIKTIFCSDVCAAYRRDVYEKVGGFVSKAIFNEDMIYAHRVIMAGYAIRYEAKACVLHAHNYTNMEQLHRNFDLGVSQAQNPDVFGALKSEKEGMKLVKTVTGELNRKGKRHTLIYFYSQCFFKYLGYTLGKKYKKLPMWMIKGLTANPVYWNQE